LHGVANNVNFIIVRNVKDIKQIYVLIIILLNLNKILNQEMMPFAIYVHLLLLKKRYIVKNVNLIYVQFVMKLKILKRNDFLFI
jgi:hypothetical protein